MPALVATSSLELGIDMGAVDLVIQVESPTSVARGLQRVGRAGHQVGAPSKGVIFPKYRGDLLEAAVVAKGMHEGSIEATLLPRNPLDVLAQQLVAMTVMDRWTVDELLATATRATPYETLSREVLEGVLGMLAGAYPSDEFAELKPRVTWDRATDVIEGRRDARVVAVTSGGTIPDRGLYGVFMVGEAGTPGRRVGELDEEMVYESRVGEVITLGASSWRIEEIGHDRVTVSPAPGVPGKLPFWHGDAVGRPIELGRALGAFVREAEADLGRGPRGRRSALDRLKADHDLDELAAENLIAYLEDEREVVGALPTDRRIVVERFRDELGDWRLVLLTPFGGRVHAPWSLALEARIGEKVGAEVQTIWSDDGIAIRLPDIEMPFETIESLLFPEPDELEELVVGQVASSALFASRFRENAARALLLPRRRPGTRTPLWQQRQRAADLLAVASRYGSFPILVETYREVLSDVFDLPALREVLGGVASREIAVHRVETLRASPFASSLLFDYVAAYMYDGDAPLAERRAGALTLDRDLLRELLGQEELRELLDPEALADLELSLQALTDDRRATTADQLHDLLRRLGDLSADEIAARTEGGAVASDAWLTELVASRRAVPARVAGDDRWIAIEDVARYRDGVGRLATDRRARRVPRPGHCGPGRLARPVRQDARAVPDAGSSPPLGAADRRRSTMRWSGSSKPGRSSAASSGRAAPSANGSIRTYCGSSGDGRWRGCGARWSRSIRRSLGRFLPAWHGVAAVGDAPPALRPVAALERLAEVVDQLAGLAIPASVLERDVLPARIPGYQPRLLDELGAMGEVAWVGRGSLGRDDGRIALYRPGREVLRPVGRADGVDVPAGPRHEAIRGHLRRRGASFYRELFAAAGGGSDREVLDALWDLVWAGRGHERHVRAAPCAALEAARPRRAAPARPPDVARPAGGRRALVARRCDGRGGARATVTALRRDPPPRNASTR